MPSPKRLAAVAAAITLAAFAWIYQRDPRIGAPALPRIAAVGEATSPASPATNAPSPASLRGSDVDGELAEDAGGHFVPTRRAIALFEYFLSASGEESDAAIRARIVAALHERLSPAAAREAESFLDRFLAYRTEAARTLGDERLAESADLERRLQWIRELRRKYFGAELASTLFGDDERAAEIAIEQRRIEADASLSETEKQARLDALERQLPDDLRRARAESTAPLQLFQAEQALRAKGGSDAEVRALRESMVGPEATARLEALDRSRAEWNARLDAYRVERDAIARDPGRDAAARSAAIEALRAQRFDTRERIRVRVIDEMDAAPAAQ